VPLLFGFYTDAVWEDFRITFRHSEDLCAGRGLVYHSGEKVHGFTPPIRVLLPAFLHLITGKSSHVPVIWLFRVVSVGCFAGAGILLLRSFGSGEDDRPARLLTAALYVVPVKAAALVINGMERPS